MKHSISAVRFQRIYGSGVMRFYPTRDSQLISCDPWGSTFWISNHLWTFGPLASAMAFGGRKNRD